MCHDDAVRPTQPLQTGYRNKVELSVGTSEDKKLGEWIHARAVTHELLLLPLMWAVFLCTLPLSSSPYPVMWSQ